MFFHIFSAEGGMGKSTALKYLALTWADGSDEKLNAKFQFVFFITLKHIKRNSGSIEDIIIKQHSGLEANGVNPTEIKSILNGDCGIRVYY